MSQTVPTHVAAIDQGTTSTRCLIFDAEGRIVASDRREHRQILPRPGWVEHDATEIWAKVQAVASGALARAGLRPDQLTALGIANQRETVVLWDRSTGRPVHNAVVWQDTRTAALCTELGGTYGQDRFRDTTGLPLAPYFAGPKIAWLLDHVPGLRHRAEHGEIAFGTIDSWLIWNLTGGTAGGVHVTDVSNASRTLLMDLHTLDWDPAILSAMDIPEAVLPRIRPSAEVYGLATGRLAGVPVAAALGDQQAALFGQTCFDLGEAKNTYGPGSFLLLNTGGRPVPSESGLLTTVAHQLGGERPVYALEGSIAITGALVEWLRDRLGVIRTIEEIEPLAASVPDNGGAYVVPAFSGLFAPYWRSDARGVITGLTAYVTRAHLARAVLEATSWQTREVVDAMQQDSGVRIGALRVDGGMTVNGLLMQHQADVLGVPVIRPVVAETTSLGAAYAAGLATGVWEGPDALRKQWREDTRWKPAMPEQVRSGEYRRWKRAVERSLGWLDDDRPAMPAGRGR
ncbi:glycerol kinase GlpK [Streptomyces cocklensis]|jgi:glycerol kinase|uniref:Glycerol kinase n=1 Tax=Actinacidiphila cocklensis TaxID=887465 RepID=A0A9W4GRG7_9ACTN|nr:glycerol kinase GlpK [Actinacidiphila cocklensis]MDD1063839.1 glycerol kinase GlpK [Actinacidiphila cocklensis]WSX73117.1 glycerol kinase GlpK [Streptomyces sp. NBC_00899]WSX80817.1 glycerol kinase GlpK [Streptomyces sp. NBC_00899]CAG6392606.1 Glycerol kinase 2 [Actinacidiphila cocklensis]